MVSNGGERKESQGGDGQEDEPAPEKRTIKDVREWLLEARHAKVRYGRATLTISRWGAVLGTPVHKQLLRFEKDEASAEDVAWAFVRERVEGHSPSFDWGKADLGRLIPLITGVASEPEMAAATPEELVDELKELAAHETEIVEKAQERFEKQLGMLSPNWNKALQGLTGISSINKTSEMLRKAGLVGGISKAVPLHDISKLAGASIDISKMTGARFDVAKVIGGSALDLAKIAGMPKLDYPGIAGIGAERLPSIASMIPKSALQTAAESMPKFDVKLPESLGFTAATYPRLNELSGVMATRALSRPLVVDPNTLAAAQIQVPKISELIGADLLEQALGKQVIAEFDEAFQSQEWDRVATQLRHLAEEIGEEEEIEDAAEALEYGAGIGDDEGPAQAEDLADHALKAFEGLDEATAVNAAALIAVAEAQRATAEAQEAASTANERVAQIEKEAAEAHERAARLEKEAAEANERAAEAINEAAKGDSVVKQVLVQIAAMALFVGIQVLLATKFGIYFIPPIPPQP
jgi:hypothetical protein